MLRCSGWSEREDEMNARANNNPWCYEKMKRLSAVWLRRSCRPRHHFLKESRKPFRSASAVRLCKHQIGSGAGWLGARSFVVPFSPKPSCVAEESGVPPSSGGVRWTRSGLWSQAAGQVRPDSGGAATKRERPSNRCGPAPCQDLCRTTDVRDLAQAPDAGSCAADPGVSRSALPCPKVAGLGEPGADPHKTRARRAFWKTCLENFV
jgi:hypothetical protein